MEITVKAPIRLLRPLVLDLERLSIIWLVISSATLLFYQLNDIPEFFYDEGYFGQIAKNTAIYGRYGSIFFDQFVPAQLSVGPTVLLPTALVFQIFGVGIWQARAISAVAALIALLMLFRKSSMLYDRLVGKIVWVLALPLLAMSGRGLYGESAAICFFLAGVWCCGRAMETKGPLSAVAAGLAFGMMLVSKPQMLLTVPVFFLVVVANHLYYRCWTRRSLQWMIVMIPMPEILSVLYQAYSLGWNAYWQFILYDLTNSTGASVFPQTKGLILHTPGFVSQQLPMLLIGIVALALSWRDCRERNSRGLLRLTLLTTTTVALVWFVVFSPGWTRYGLLANVLMCLFIGARLVGFARKASALIPFRYRHFTQAVLSCSLILLIPLSDNYQFASRRAQNDVLAVVASINRFVPANALIESYEWPVDVLTNRWFHHPNLADHLPRVQHFLLNSPQAPPPYEFWQFRPTHLVVGPMGIAMQAYPLPLLKQCAGVLAQHGSYTLYRIDDSSCFDRYAHE